MLALYMTGFYFTTKDWSWPALYYSYINHRQPVLARLHGTNW